MNKIKKTKQTFLLAKKAMDNFSIACEKFIKSDAYSKMIESFKKIK